jgi:hypothetical protein
VLAQLDKIEGVERSYANHAGNMVRLSVAAAADPAKVAEQALKVLKDQNRNPIRLTDDEFKVALTKEEWRAGERIGELSSIEYRTLGLRRVKAFADQEKLDKEITNKLMKIAEEEWDRLAQENAPADPNQPGKVDWSARCRQFDDAVANRATPILTAEQMERFKKSLARSPASTRTNEGKN